MNKGQRPGHVLGTKKQYRRVSRGSSNGDTIQQDAYLPPVLANPGVLIEVEEKKDEYISRLEKHAGEVCSDGSSDLIQGIKVGGGVIGHNLAHENEAPFPQNLAEWFIRSHCPPGGIVLDPFSGSGTTAAAAIALGRQGIGLDLRFNQCELARRRCEDVQPILF